MLDFGLKALYFLLYLSALQLDLFYTQVLVLAFDYPAYSRLLFLKVVAIVLLNTVLFLILFAIVM